MRILHVIPSVLSGPYISAAPIAIGVRTVSISRTCRLRRAGADNQCERSESRAGCAHDHDVSLNGVNVRYCRRIATENASLDMLRLLPSAIEAVDLVHLTAVYSFPTIPVLALAKRAGKPVVWSPRGALQRWEGSTKLHAKRAWEGVCRLVAPSSVMLHVTSAEESEESAAKIRGASTAIIPNGVEIPATITREAYGRGELRLGLSRPAPSEEGSRESSLRLPVAPRARAQSPVEAEDSRRRRPRLHRVAPAANRFAWSPKSRHLTGEVIGDEKARFFATADLLLMPSYTENFGMVVCRSASPTAFPSMASTGSPWQSAPRQRAADFRVANDPAMPSPYDCPRSRVAALRKWARPDANGCCVNSVGNIVPPKRSISTELSLELAEFKRLSQLRHCLLTEIYPCKSPPLHPGEKTPDGGASKLHG